MASELKAIETQYKGYRFRSRLEARWAVFLDHLGKQWEYEPQGFDLGAAGWYLPDFHISGSEECWLEIKPDQEPTKADSDKWIAFTEQAQTPIYVSFGTPSLPSDNRSAEYRVMAILLYPGMVVKDSLYDLTKPFVDPRHWLWHERTADNSFTLWPVPSFEPVDDETEFMRYPWNSRMIRFRPDDTPARVIDPILAGTKTLWSPRLAAAYEAARSARFEYGECGAPGGK